MWTRPLVLLKLKHDLVSLDKTETQDNEKEVKEEKVVKMLDMGL